jgi:ubiquinone/menaquinone biosynthesis C-methylase UbiE
MSLTDATSALIDGFSTEYSLTGAPLLEQIEQSVCGCAYGASSWTTRAEADSAVGMLGLAPDKRLLDVGTGCGWPGLYLASVSGCEAMLLDMPFSGLQAAARRAADDGMAERCLPVQGDGAAIPFADASFDAIFHSDVLCCLDPKLDVLRECRRVIRESGTMVFSVLSVRPGLSAAEAEQAATLGPAFVGSPHGYPTLLEMTGWAITKHIDVSAGFERTVTNLLEAEEKHLESLADLRGEQRQSERLATMRKRRQGVVSDLIRRDIFQVAPA